LYVLYRSKNSQLSAIQALLKVLLNPTICALLGIIWKIWNAVRQCSAARFNNTCYVTINLLQSKSELLQGLANIKVIDIIINAESSASFLKNNFNAKSSFSKVTWQLVTLIPRRVHWLFGEAPNGLCWKSKPSSCYNVCSSSVRVWKKNMDSVAKWWLQSSSNSLRYPESTIQLNFS
jgi:hypothetical protein